MISVSLGGPEKHYINWVLLPLDFYIICDFVRHQLSTYYHLLWFQSFSHSLEICCSDGLHFTLFGSTLGLCSWREKPRHLDQLLHTYCNFVWFALSSRATNSTSLVAMDFIGLLPEDNGFNCILMMTDQLNTNIQIVTTRTDITVPDLAAIFFNRWYCENGLPLKIVSDHDKLFMSKFC